MRGGMEALVPRPGCRAPGDRKALRRRQGRAVGLRVSRQSGTRSRRGKGRDDERGRIAASSAQTDDSKGDDGVAAATRVVGLCTVACKATGLAREVLLTSLYGIGPVMDAFAYACVVPAYFQVVVGGLNGPIHTAVLVSAKKGEVEDGASTRRLIESLSTWLAVPAAALALALFCFPGRVLRVFAPGLCGAGSALELSIAQEQLRIMSPCVLIGVLTGIAFGGLNAKGNFLFPSLGQGVANVVMVAAILGAGGGCAAAGAMEGGRCLALAFLLGSAGQLLVQGIAMHGRGVSTLLRPRLSLADWPGVSRAARVLVPATLSSTMLQLATYTDLWFASAWRGAAAVMGCAAMVVTAPVGLLSSAIVVPRMPLLTQQAAELRWDAFRDTLDDMLRTGIALGLPLSISLACFAEQIVRAVYQRSAFDARATQEVVPVVVTYALGAGLFICRDVAVRAFYSLGEGRAPVAASLAALAVNAVLDALLSRTMANPAVGLVLSTVLVTSLSFAWLYCELARSLAEKVAAAGSSPPPTGEASPAAKWRTFLAKSAAASAVTAAHCKAVAAVAAAARDAHALPLARKLAGALPVSAEWIADASLLGVCLVSSWAVYYLCSRLLVRVAGL